MGGENQGTREHMPPRMSFIDDKILNSCFSPSASDTSYCTSINSNGRDYVNFHFSKPTSWLCVVALIDFTPPTVSTASGRGDREEIPPAHVVRLLWLPDAPKNRIEWAFARWLTDLPPPSCYVTTWPAATSWRVLCCQPDRSPPLSRNGYGSLSL